jgi:hypothetical protein
MSASTILVSAILVVAASSVKLDTSFSWSDDVANKASVKADRERQSASAESVLGGKDGRFWIELLPDGAGGKEVAKHCAGATREDEDWSFHHAIGTLHMQVDVGRGNETLLGTGFVVTVNDAPYILTAAHNFVHQDKVNGKISEATHAEFFLARNGEYTYGRKFVVSSFLVHPKYYSHADPEDGYDIAIAAVEKPHLLEPSLASLPAIWLEADHADDWESMQNVKRKIDRSSCIAWFGRLREREKVSLKVWRTMQGLADDATACERILWFRGWADYWSGRETLWQDTDSFMVAGYPGE